MLEQSNASHALNFFLHAGNNPVMLKNSTEHTETLFIALVEFGQLTMTLGYRKWQF